VDVGGGKGHTSITLADANPRLKFIVQDLYVDSSLITPGLEARVSFMVHDFFQPQPIESADIYMFSLIMHNWSDVSVTKILRQTIPALKPGARILVLGRLLPEWGELKNFEMKEMLAVDVMMMTLMNAKQRSVQCFVSLFAAADPRLKFNRIYRGVGTWWESASSYGVAEIVYKNNFHPIPILSPLAYRIPLFGQTLPSSLFEQTPDLVISSFKIYLKP
jgi:hypothetical protein